MTDVPKRKDGNMETLGQQLAESLWTTTDLILLADDAEVVHALVTRQRVLSEQLQALVDADVPRGTEAYTSATEALREANTALLAAGTDATRVAGGLTLLADAAVRVERLIEVLK